MLPYQERIVNESNELSDKISKLSTFLKTPMFTDLPREEKVLLKQQHMLMLDYRTILIQRINRFKDLL